MKARYQKLCEEANFNAASSSDSSHQSAFWKCIWKLHVPNKIKNFLWKVCSNALSTKVNLKKEKFLMKQSVVPASWTRKQRFMPFGVARHLTTFGPPVLAGSE